MSKLQTLIDTLNEPALRAIAQRALDCIIILDLEERIRFVNWTLPDYTVEEVTGQSVHRFTTQDASAIYRRVRETKRPAREEAAYVSPSGEVIYWETRTSPIIEDNQLVGYLSISSDITERRAAAADRDRFFELSIDALCLTDFDGHFKRVNPAFMKMLGYSEAELLSAPQLDFIHPDDVAHTRKADAALARGEDQLDLVNRYRCKDGSYRTLSWRKTSDPTGQRIHAVGRDITDQQSMELRLMQSQKMDAIGRMAAGIAHDFNNLVLAILANSELAVRALGRDHEAAKFVSEARLAAERAGDLTKRLLTFSRHTPMKTAALDVDKLIDDLTRMLRRLIPEDIDLEITASNEPAIVDADHSQLEQVLVNLCVNARDAMPSGGKLSISVDIVSVGPQAPPHVDLTPGKYVVVCVRDTGVGMSSDVRERIFEPFYSTKEPRHGTGLGLSTVYAIVAQHQGAIHVDSEPGRGSTFRTYLPWVEGSPAKPSQRPEASPNGGELLLIAEDERVVRTVVTTMLEHGGYRVVAAANGLEAVRLFKEHRDEVALALLDVVMPELGGPAAYQQIAEVKPDLPVIFTSGYAQDSRFVGTLPAEAPTLGKPYSPEELLRLVRKVIDAKTAADTAANPANSSGY